MSSVSQISLNSSIQQQEQSIDQAKASVRKYSLVGKASVGGAAIASAATIAAVALKVSVVAIPVITSVGFICFAAVAGLFLAGMAIAYLIKAHSINENVDQLNFQLKQQTQKQKVLSRVHSFSSQQGNPVINVDLYRKELNRLFKRLNDQQISNSDQRTVEWKSDEDEEISLDGEVFILHGVPEIEATLKELKGQVEEAERELKTPIKELEGKKQAEKKANRELVDKNQELKELLAECEALTEKTSPWYAEQVTKMKKKNGCLNGFLSDCETYVKRYLDGNASSELIAGRTEITGEEFEEVYAAIREKEKTVQQWVDKLLKEIEKKLNENVTDLDAARRIVAKTMVNNSSHRVDSGEMSKLIKFKWFGRGITSEDVIQMIEDEEMIKKFRWCASPSVRQKMSELGEQIHAQRIEIGKSESKLAEITESVQEAERSVSRIRNRLQGEMQEIVKKAAREKAYLDLIEETLRTPISPTETSQAMTSEGVSRGSSPVIENPGDQIVEIDGQSPEKPLFGRKEDQLRWEVNSDFENQIQAIVAATNSTSAS